MSSFSLAIVFVVLWAGAAQAALGINNLAGDGTGANQTSYTTAAISPTANALVLVSVQNTTVSGTPNTPTVTGCSMTWTQVITDRLGSTVLRMTMFRGLSASPGSGCALTIDFAGQEQTDITWVVNEWTGVDTGGTNGSAAVVQSNSDDEAAAAVTSADVSLAAFGDATNNGAYGCFLHSASQAPTEGSGFTLLGTGSTGTGRRTDCEYKTGEDTVVDMSWGASSATAVGIAMEIKVASAPAGVSGRRSMRGFGK